MKKSCDRCEIRELLDRSQIYIDLNDGESWAALFTADGVYESPFGESRGRHGLVRTVTELNRAGVTKGKRHMTGPAKIEVSGETASVISYYWVVEAEQEPGVVASGEYHDTLKKVDGEWKIGHRKQTVDSSWKPQANRRTVRIHD